MVSQRAKFLLNSINQQIDEKYKSSDEKNDEKMRMPEENTRLEQERKQREQDIIAVKIMNKEHQRQNERIDNDKKRVRDAERVLGREMYNRARTKVYGS